MSFTKLSLFAFVAVFCIHSVYVPEMMVIMSSDFFNQEMSVFIGPQISDKVNNYPIDDQPFD
jgi:hypothetical protein